MSTRHIATVKLKCDRPAQVLVVLLPGAYVGAQQFVAAGFARARDARATAIDLLVLDADPALFPAADIIAALRDTVIVPARAAYREIWLAGVSLGGLLALDYVAQHPGVIDGVCLIAPYPGTRPTLLQIQAEEEAGGESGGAPPLHVRAGGDDPESRAWRWLRDRPAGFPVYLGYGMADRFAQGIGLMAKQLAPECVDTIGGAHEWPVWSTLWERFLERGWLGQRASGGAS